MTEDRQDPVNRLRRPDGAEIAWYDDGPTDGPVVLLLMGLGYPAAAWYRQVPIVAERYRVLRPENRGAGLTGAVPGGPYSVETMAADAVAVMDTAGVAVAHVVGISMGGTIAQEVALGHPDRVRSLTLMATHPGAADSQWDTAALEMLGSRGSVTPAEAAEFSLPYNYAPETPRERIEEDWAVRLPLAASDEGYRNQLVGSSAWSGLRRLPDLRVPTLVLHGELDALVLPVNGKLIADTIPGAEFVAVPGANHILTTDQTEIVHGHLLNWLSRNDIDRP